MVFAGVFFFKLAKLAMVIGSVTQTDFSHKFCDPSRIEINSQLNGTTVNLNPKY